MKKSFVLSYGFRASEIESLTTTRFREVFDVTAMPSPMLRQLLGTVSFRLHGYGRESRPPFMVQEIRRYFVHLDQQTEGALAFLSELNSNFLLTVAACHMQTMTVLSFDRNGTMQIEYDVPDLRHYIRRSADAIWKLGKKAQLSEARIAERQAGLQNYFHKKMSR